MEKYWAKIISTEATGKYADATARYDGTTGIGIFYRWIYYDCVTMIELIFTRYGFKYLAFTIFVS